MPTQHAHHFAFCILAIIILNAHGHAARTICIGIFHDAEHLLNDSGHTWPLYCINHSFNWAATAFGQKQKRRWRSGHHYPGYIHV
jgi:hypothetical protein